MTYEEILKQGVGLLRRAGIEEADTDAIILLSHATGRDKAYLYAHAEKEPEKCEWERYFHYIDKRIRRMPIAYIAGFKEFMSLSFLVGPEVLIPRPETELLVEKAVEHADKRGSKKLRILDLGTGSGCIAVSLAHYVKNCHVTASDISEKSIQTARINAERNMVAERLEFVCCDMFKGLHGRKFDIIVSNPPYIPTDDILRLEESVRMYEPVSALDGGRDGFFYYGKIIRESVEYINENGSIFLEAGYGQADAIARMMGKAFYDVRTYNDLRGIPRVLSGKLYTKTSNNG